MFRKLLVPLDRSELAEQAIGQAAAIARKSNAGMDVVLVHQPVPYAGFSDVPWYAEQWKDELKYVETIANELESGSGVHTTFSVPKGDVVDMICERAVEVDADLIVMTSHGRTGLSRIWLGSVADGVIRNAKSPVLLMRPIETKMERAAARKLFSHVLITLDGSTLSEEILSPALALARSGDSRITLLRVVQPIPMMVADPGIPFAYAPPPPDPVLTDALIEAAKKQTAGVAQRLSEQGFKVDMTVISSPFVAQTILDFASDRGIDVIAISTRGRGASRLLVGSVADKLIRGSGLPMLIQRPVGVRSSEYLTSDQSAEVASPAMAHVE
jgi:nucleotide-binding universal stress UspA family protein